ncbi:MAG: efflux RND transporter periplasmic adaptor subunit [Proteobacteria bacterium]|nr:efflux RND transporter periplasmic adaptor subunit [Pseudomonadota bacterium]
MINPNTRTGQFYFTERVLILLLFTACLFISSCNKNNNSSMKYTGIMDADITRVSSQAQGIITGLKFDEGMLVKNDQVLVNVETEKLGYQLDQNKALLEELKNQYNALLAQLEKAKFERDNIKVKYDRFLNLFKINAAVQQDVDDLKTQYGAANEQVNYIRSSIDAINSKAKQVKSASDIINKQLKDATITSPVTGTVLVRYVENGELLTTGSPVCDIADISTLWTKIYVEEKNLPFIKLGQKVQVKIDGIEDKTMEGRVSWISDQSEFTPKTILTEETKASLVYAAKVTVSNDDGILKIGMPVTVIVNRES